MAVTQVLAQVAQVFGKPIPQDALKLYAIPRSNPRVMFDLDGHTLTDIAYTDQDRAVSVRFDRIRGRIVRREFFTGGQQYTRMAGVIGISDGAVSLIEQIAENPTCWDFVVGYECPTSACESFYFLVKDGIVSQPRYTTSIIGTESTGEPIRQTATFDMTDLIRVYNRATVRSTVFADPIYAVGFTRGVCAAGCVCDPNSEGYWAGGNGTAAGTTFRTTNGFGTGSSQASGIPAAHVGTDIYTDSSITLVAYASSSDFLTGTTGGIRYTTNDGGAWGAASGLANTAIYGIVKAAGRFIAVGTNAIFTSTDGITWTALTTGLVAGVNLAAVAYDSSTATAYIVGENSGAGVAYRLTGNTLTPVTYPGTVLRFTSVAVVNPDYVVMGGNGGLVYEAPTASTASSTSGWLFASYGSANVRAVGGNLGEVWIGVSTSLLYRSPLTFQDYKAVTIAPALTGDVTDIAIATDDRGVVTAVRAATSAGEIVTLQDCIPDLCGLY